LNTSPISYADFQKTCVMCIRWALLVFLQALVVFGTEARSEKQEARNQGGRRAVTVADSIRMTKLPSWPQVAFYSPDRKKFVVVLRKGNLEQNTNEYSLLLWKADDIFRSSTPQVLLTMSSSSNRAAIEYVNWFPDDETIAFLGEHPGELRQVYTFNISTLRLTRVTDHPTNITWFSMTPNADALVYSAETPVESFFNENTRREGLVVSIQNLPSLIRDVDRHMYNEQLFIKRQSEPLHRLKTLNKFMSESNYGPPTLSPDGKYIVLTTHPSEFPEWWQDYTDPEMRQTAGEKLQPGQDSWFYRYELIDSQTGQSRVLIDAPTGIYGTELTWLSDSRSILISNIYLPLVHTTSEERKARQSNTYLVEVKVPNGELTEIIKNGDEDLILRGWDARTSILATEGGRKKPKLGPKVYFEKSKEIWQKVQKNEEETRPEIVVEEDINTPPKIFARDSKAHRKAMLLDLNPQFGELRFGRVDEIKWKGTDGHDVNGGLYYPIDYVAGRKYPLVIQTHGWFPGQFLIDGIFPSAFAAQGLAGKNIMVLQANEAFDDQNTPKEVENEVATFEGAIDFLDQRGFIDRNRVGIVGFSRTCFFVKYALTHSPYHFAAASIEDGIEASYFQYIVWANSSSYTARAYPAFNGGPPFGKTLKSWLEQSPGFNLDKVVTPVRLVVPRASQLFQDWEWYVGLSSLSKAVEMIMMEDGAHLLVKPWERMLSLQGNVDWFCFWLKGEEDPDPAKAEQYARWRELRKLQGKNEGAPAQSVSQ